MEQVDSRRQPAKRWYKQWVPQDTVLNPGKLRLQKWINDDTMNLMKTKHLDDQVDEDYEVVYVCTFENCGKVFTEAPALRKHAHVHGEKQHICHYEGCGKRFVDSSKLKRHYLIHTGEKHFMCKICGKAFSLDFNLRSHMRTHTGENYHTCPVEDCGKRYAHEYKLRGHMKTHHDKIMLPEGKPEVENKTSTTAAAGGRPFVCPHEGCDKRYTYEYKLNLHLKRGHAKEELVEQNGSDELSDGSDERTRRGSGKGKLKKLNPETSANKRRKTASASARSPAQASRGVSQNIRLVQRKPVAKVAPMKPEVHEDSEETEDEGRDDQEEMDIVNGGFEDDEETEDDLDT